MYKALISVIFILAHGLAFAQDRTMLFNENGLIYTVAIPLDSNRYEVKVIRRVNCAYFYWQIKGDTLTKNGSGVFTGKKFMMNEVGNVYKIRDKSLFSKRIVLSPKSECDKETIFILNKFEKIQTSNQIRKYGDRLIGYPDYEIAFVWSINRLTDSIMKNTCYSKMLQILADQKTLAFKYIDSLYQEKVEKLSRIKSGQFGRTSDNVLQIILKLGDSDIDAQILNCLILNYTEVFIEACVLLHEDEYSDLRYKFYTFPKDIDANLMIEALGKSQIIWSQKSDFIKQLKKAARHSKKRWM